jgi:SAM-dependent methyltransferase
MSAIEPVWRRYLTDYNEGLGVVYERFILNDYLDGLVDRYQVRSALEAPLYGMAGVSGINSVRLAQRDCDVTLIDVDASRLAGVERIWKELALPATLLQHSNLTRLPFTDGAFDLAWCWAALWYLPDPAALVKELARVSRKLVFLAMPNRWQPGYLLRRYFIDKPFFKTVNESWTDMGRIKAVLWAAGYRLADEGVLDVPPWPDTVMPAADLLPKLGIRSQALRSRFTGSGWQWSTMDYYLGRQPDLRDRVMRYAWLDHARLPWELKSVWAHHRYVLATRI